MKILLQNNLASQKPRTTAHKQKNSYLMKGMLCVVVFSFVAGGVKTYLFKKKRENKANKKRTVSSPHFENNFSLTAVIRREY